MKLKPKFPSGEKHIDQITPPKLGMTHQISGQVSIEQAHTLGTQLLTCPICYIRFHRPASHAARVNVNYCSRACYHEGMREKFEIPCVVCGKTMLLIRSEIPKIKACSRKCQSLRMAGPNPPDNHLYPYRDAVKQMIKRGVCSQCGTTDGPWDVRGVTVKDYEADTSKARLWCEQCHLTDLSPYALKARKDQRGY